MYLLSFMVLFFSNAEKGIHCVLITFKRFKDAETTSVSQWF